MGVYPTPGVLRKQSGHYSGDFYEEKRKSFRTQIPEPFRQHFLIQVRFKTNGAHLFPWRENAVVLSGNGLDFVSYLADLSLVAFDVGIRRESFGRKPCSPAPLLFL